MREQPTLRVVGDVDLDGARAIAQLIRQRKRMAVVERRRDLRRVRGQELEDLGIDRLLVAVMRADGDDVVQMDFAVGLFRRTACKQDGGDNENETAPHTGPSCSPSS